MEDKVVGQSWSVCCLPPGLFPPTPDWTFLISNNAWMIDFQIIRPMHSCTSMFTRDGDSQVDMVDLGKVLRQAGDGRLSMEAVEVPRQNLLLLLEECEEWRGVSELLIRREVEVEHEVGDEGGRGKASLTSQDVRRENGQRRPAASLPRTLVGSTSSR